MVFIPIRGCLLGPESIICQAWGPKHGEWMCMDMHGLFSLEEGVFFLRKSTVRWFLHVQEIEGLLFCMR